MIRQSTLTGRTFSTSSIHREVIHAHGHRGSNQNCMSSRSCASAVVMFPSGQVGKSSPSRTYAPALPRHHLGPPPARRRLGPFAARVGYGQRAA